MVEILSARPAATVVTLRDGPEGFEVLMLRRNLRSDFVGGAYVFPGGGVDAADAGARAEGVTRGVTEEEASQRLNISSGGQAYYVAGLRELFEEGGLLLVSDRDGGSANFSDPEVGRRMTQHRRAINGAGLGFIEMIENEQLLLDLGELAYFAHWITPRGLTRRYDTRFFVARAPRDQIAVHDAGETIADRWLRPIGALEAHARGEFDMMFPTIRILESIQYFSLASDVVAFANSLAAIEAVEPRLVKRNGATVVLAPGDEGFDD